MSEDVTKRRSPFAVDELTSAECWELLRSSRVGRLASCAQGRPYIVPVNFIVDGRTIVFRTAEGTKLAAVRHAAPVSFEIDDHDPQTGTATSVVVTGRATEITEPDEWDAAQERPLFPWHVEPKAYFVRISPDEVTGRRFRAVYTT